MRRIQAFVLIAVVAPSAAAGQRATAEPTAAETPVARGSVFATLAERDLVPEGSAWDPVTRSFLIGSLNKSKVVAVDSGGTVTDRAIGSGLGSVVGIHVDTQRSVLWVASNARYDSPSDTTTPALFAFDAPTGAFLRRIDAPPGDVFLNDLTSGSDGTVYVTDSRTPRVLMLRPGADSFDTFEATGTLRQPNGITISPDGRLLFVTDRDHVRVVALATGETWRLEVPDSIDMAGIDGLAHTGTALIAHHTLVRWRVARYGLDAEARRVIAVDFIERNTPDMRTSTTGEVVGNTYYYIGNGQLDRMNAGTIDSATMDPVRLYRAPLANREESVVAVSLSGVDSVAFFDAGSLERRGEVAVESTPHEIAVSPDGRTLYVANARGGSISVIEAASTPRVRATWPLPDSISVHDVADGGTGTVWAVSGEPPLLLGLDARTGEVIRRHEMERAGSWMVDERGPDGAVTISHLEGGAVTLFDPATNRHTILEGVAGQIDAAATPDLSRIWSVNTQTGELTIFDVRSGSVVSRMRSGAGAGRVVFTPDGRTGMIVNSDEATVDLRNVATAELMASVAVPDGPKVIALRGDGRLAYLTHPSGALTMIDIPSATVLLTVPLAGTPDGVAVGRWTGGGQGDENASGRRSPTGLAR